ncbi:MAG TPA: glutamate--tRNA ligase [Micropepsaceae bacterium]|nr:glutamate--tRNA ligase [Micropepsaceae bacterium]
MAQDRPLVTRFAPSPTGFLHIGGARTALFNWLYARHFGGTFRLRIEDTDRERSKPEAIDALLQGLSWLGLDWDGDVVFQFARAARHAEIAHQLLAQGKAYYCYATPDELEEMRNQQKAEGKPQRYDGRWRDRAPDDARRNVKPAIRIKCPQTGDTLIEDRVQGDVRFRNDVLDDFIILRSDGTPTYMLSVVVDDFDMGVTHVIRGDDHLTNAARQRQIIDAMGWPVPVYAHLPMLHGPDGAKLSKRHGAQGIHEFEGMGYLPEAMRNYLLRLGWSHGDDELISTEQAIQWFDLDAVQKSPARLDYKKLDFVNGHYIREADDARLAELVIAHRKSKGEPTATDHQRQMLIAGMKGLKERAKTIIELADSAAYVFASRPLALDDKAAKILTPEARATLSALLPALATGPWEAPLLEAAVRSFAESKGRKLGDVAQPLRAALTGRSTSPPVFDVMATLGRDETVARLGDAASG